MKTLIAILFIFLFILIGCSPHIFRLNQNIYDRQEIGGMKIGNLDSVDVYAKNAFVMYSGALVDLLCNEYPVTQFRADFSAEIERGEGIRFSFRTIIDSYDSHPNISFDYTTSGCLVKENDKLIVSVDSIKAETGKTARIIIENYGKLFNIIVDCDTVYYGKTELPATQHMILKTLPDSDIRLTGIDFEDLNLDVVDMMELVKFTEPK